MDDAETLAATLRRVALERDRYRWSCENLRGQCKSLRQKLRREQADHQQTLMRLEALRALLPENNSPC